MSEAIIMLTRTCQTTLFHGGYMPFLLQKDSLIAGNVLKWKHCSIIIGCWHIHWSTHLWYRQVYTSMNNVTCIKQACQRFDCWEANAHGSCQGCHVASHNLFDIIMMSLVSYLCTTFLYESTTGQGGSGSGKLCLKFKFKHFDTRTHHEV